MWFKRFPEMAAASHIPTPAQLTLRDLIAAQPRVLRGPLAPGERLPTGMRPSRRRAQGADFDSIGPYAPGDDVRWMDWRATARTGRAQMKRFVAESHVARMLIVDMRPPMFFGARHGPMAKTAALAAARFAWESLGLSEPVGLIVVPTAEVIQPRRGKEHVLYLLQHLEACYQALAARRDSAPGESLARAVELAAAQLRRGDAICAISDFGEPQGQLANASAGLSETHKLSAVIIEDAIMTEPIPAGRYPMRMANGEGRDTAAVAHQAAREQARIAADMRQALRLQLGRCGWETLILNQSLGDGARA